MCTCTEKRWSSCYKYTEAHQAVECGEMYGVQLRGSYNIPLINKQQFYQTLCDSMTARLLTQTENSLVHEISLIMPSAWTEQISPEYREHELKRLYQISHNLQ